MSRSSPDDHDRPRPHLRLLTDDHPQPATQPLEPAYMALYGWPATLVAVLLVVTIAIWLLVLPVLGLVALLRWLW